MNNATGAFTLRAGPGAFGDGRHPTTAGVLAALEAIDPGQFRPRRALDMGSGSGILSLAMAARFGCPVWAAEIDRQAVETLRENVAANGYDRQVIPILADGFDHPALAGPFDLMAINILAEPLLALAAAADAALAPGGVLVLSGMLAWQEPQIREAYQSLGLELAARLTLRDWVTLSFAKP